MVNSQTTNLQGFNRMSHIMHTQKNVLLPTKERKSLTEKRGTEREAGLGVVIQNSKTNKKQCVIITLASLINYNTVKCFKAGQHHDHGRHLAHRNNVSIGCDQRTKNEVLAPIQCHIMRCQ